MATYEELIGQILAASENEALKLKGSIAGLITLLASDNTTPHNLKFPDAQGAAGTYLQNDGSGNLTWESVAASFITDTLSDNSSNTALSSFTFAHATYNGVKIDYRIKEASTNNVRTGTLQVATDGSNASIVDTYTETSDPGVTWTAAVSGANVEIRYTTTSTGNSRNIKATVTKFEV